MESEDEILEEKCKEKSPGGCSMLYAFGASRFITSLLKAMKGNPDIYECAYVRQVDNIGEFLPYMSTIVKLGKDGVQQSYMPKLNEYECCLLEKVSEKLKDSIELGKSFVTGEFPKQAKRIPYISPICSQNLDCFVLKANFPVPPHDPCGKVTQKLNIDPHLIRSTQKAIKLSLEQKERDNQPKKPKEKPYRKICKNKCK